MIALRTAASVAFIALVACSEKEQSTASTTRAPDAAAITQLVQTPPAPIDPASVPDGAEMVATHCQRCHMLGDPAVLTQQLWVNAVLPEMGCYMGLHHQIPPYARFREKGRNADEQAVLDQAGLYPAQPLIVQADWDQIVTYYLENAPRTLVNEARTPLPLVPREHYSARFIGPANRRPQTTLIKIDEARQQLYTSDDAEQRFTVRTFAGETVAERPSTGTFVDVQRSGGELKMLEIGVLIPSDESKGRFWALDGGANSIRPLASPALKRPVDFEWVDLDGDGADEVVVAEYGNKTGQLAIYKQKADGNWGRKVLNSRSGNRIVKARDMNADGFPDLVVLRAQESEDVLIYYNLGGLNFRESTVIKNPSYWGSNDLEVADLDGDGALDLALANGDNADSTQVLKDFHSITLYQNKGDGSFRQVQTIPFHGAYGVRASDLDHDGDLDLVAFSAFPDFENDPTSLIRLENDGVGNFSASAYPESARSRWMVMDVADADGDGDDDIVLGAHLPGPSKVPAAFLEAARSVEGTILYIENRQR